MTTVPSARVMADSISDGGIRLTTMEVVMHRFVLAEFNTHRVFSRNSASSRAIPVTKQIDRVLNDTAIPIEFGSNQKGMQAGPPLEGEELEAARQAWINAANSAVHWADTLADLGVHKQVTNRLLEPFMWHTVIVTSTEWDNFFNQRVSPLAQPEIREAATAMLEAYKESVPRYLDETEYHLPYIDDEDRRSVYYEEDLPKISAARCARVSYLTQNGTRDHAVDLELYERLTTADPPHFSPLEHVARPDHTNITWHNNAPLARLGNFPGWSQLRHQIR